MLMSMGRRTIRRGGLLNSQTAFKESLCVLSTGMMGAIIKRPQKSAKVQK